MEKQTVIFDSKADKKHSVCYKTSQGNPATTSIYIMKTAFGNNPATMTFKHGDLAPTKDEVKYLGCSINDTADITT